METQQSLSAQEVYRALTDRALGRKKPGLSIRHVLRRGPFARVRSGVRTGRTAHFNMWQADLGIRRALEGITLVSIVDRLTGLPEANAYGILSRAGYRNVWQLTQASKHDLLAIKGFGPAKLALVKADLDKHQVGVDW